MPSPLDNPPIYPDYLKPILTRFKDVIQYKPDVATRLTLLEIVAYQDLFGVKLHPYIITLIFQLDATLTGTYNHAINNQL